MDHSNTIRNAYIVAIACLTLWVQDGWAQLTQLGVDENLFFSSNDLTLPIFAPESENDDDLGIQKILRPKEDYDPFNLYGDAGWFFTDNAGLVDTARVEDNIFQSNVTLSYLPILKGNLFGEATLRENTFRYNRNSVLDFDSIDAGTGLVYVIRSLGDISVFARYNYSSFHNPHANWAKTFDNHSIQLGFYKPWEIRRNHFAYASFISDISFDATPGFAQRDDHSMTLGYRFTPTPKWKTEFFYRAAYLKFDQRNREDWNHVLGAAVTYNINSHFAISSSVSYNNNDSNLVGGDYEAWLTGIQLKGIIQF